MEMRNKKEWPTFVPTKMEDPVKRKGKNWRSDISRFFFLLRIEFEITEFRSDILLCRMGYSESIKLPFLMLRIRIFAYKRI